MQEFELIKNGKNISNQAKKFSYISGIGIPLVIGWIFQK